MSVNYSNTFSLDTTDGSLSGGNQDYVDVHNVPNGKTVYIAIAPGTYSDFAASWQIEFNYGEINYAKKKYRVYNREICPIT